MEEEDYEEGNPFFDRLRNLCSWAFQVVLFLFLASLLLREFYPGFFKEYMDVSWFLLFIMIFGLLSLLFPTRYVEEVEKQIISKDFILTVLLGTFVGYYAFLRVKNSGWFGYFIALLCALVVISLFFLVIIRSKKKSPDKK
jgi:sugar phosphate permease